MVWSRNVTRGGERGAYRGFVWKPGVKRPLGRPCADWRIILKWIVKKSVEGR